MRLSTSVLFSLSLFAALAFAQTTTPVPQASYGPGVRSRLNANFTATANRSVSLSVISPVVGMSGQIVVLNTPVPVHLTRLWCGVQAATNVVLNLDKRSEGSIATDSTHHILGSDLTATTSGAATTTFSNSSTNCGATTSCALAVHTPVVLTVTSVAGTPGALNCTLDYTVD